MIWDPFQGKRIHNLETGHRGNIFSVKFLPMSNNGTLATGAADSKILVFDINRNETPTLRCNCHKSRVKRLATAADQPFMFWSAAEDGYVFQYDLREPHHCRSNDKILLINLKTHTGRYSEAKCIAVNQVRTEQLVVGAHDCYARLYDRRMISVSQVADFMDDTDDSGGESSGGGGAAVVTDNLPKGCVQYYCPGHLGTLKQTVTHRAATYVTFSPNGTELLMNLGSEQIYLFDINNAREPQFLNLPAYQQPSAGGADTVMVDSPKRRMTDEVEKQKKLGNDHLENENYLQAILQYTMAIQKAPESPVLYLNRATALMRRKWFGDFYDALKDCHTALHLDPGYVRSRFFKSALISAVLRATDLRFRLI
jgi:WD and tetratricopeptide repeats protein 1